MTRKGRIGVLVGGLVVVVGAGAAIAWAAGGNDATSFARGTAVSATSSSAGPTGPVGGDAAGSGSTLSANTPATPSPSADAPSSAPAPASASATGSPVAEGRSVDVALGYADWDSADGVVEAAGFVSGVVESGGICTLTLTNGTASLVATSVGQADATTTNCGRLTIPRSQVAGGTWRATLGYRSDVAHGLSQPMTVKVPAP